MGKAASFSIFLPRLELTEDQDIEQAWIKHWHNSQLQRSWSSLQLEMWQALRPYHEIHLFCIAFDCSLSFKIQYSIIRRFEPLDW